MYQPNAIVDGIFRGQKADFDFSPEIDGGALTARGVEWVETLKNDDIVAVITPRSAPNAADNTHEILFVSCVTSDPLSPEYKLEAVQATNLPQSFVDANSASSRLEHLSQSKAETSSCNLHIIISTLSGTGYARNYFDQVVKPALSAVSIEDSDYHLHITTSDKSILNFTHETLFPVANQGTSQTVLLLSGDGGMVDIVNELLSSHRSERYVKPTIGLIAIGTGNAFANSTNLNRGLTKGLRQFFQGESRSVPTFTAAFSEGSQYLVDEGRQTEALVSSDGSQGVVYGAVVCSWALHASLVADSDTTELRKYGSQRFQMAAKELLMPSDGSEPHTYRGKVSIFKTSDKGQEVSRSLDTEEHMYILATLVSNLEEKLTISPQSKPLDGQLRLLHFGPLPSAEVMRILTLAFQGGQHVDNNTVTYEDIDGLRIEFNETDGHWRRVCVDGKIIQVGEGGWVEVRKNKATDVVDVLAKTSL